MQFLSEDKTDFHDEYLHGKTPGTSFPAGSIPTEKLSLRPTDMGNNALPGEASPFKGTAIHPTSTEQPTPHYREHCPYAWHETGSGVHE